MPTIIVDDAIRDQLLAAKDTVEFRDRQGRLLAQVPVRFLPPDESEFPSEEELERIMREGRSFTPEEVMERLRSLREQHRDR
jgi:hypothetical protein